MLRKLIEIFVAFSGFSLAARMAWVSFVLGALAYTLSFVGHDENKDYILHKDSGLVVSAPHGSSFGYSVSIEGEKSGRIRLHVSSGVLNISGGKKSIVGEKINFEYYGNNLFACDIGGVPLCESKCGTPSECQFMLSESGRRVFHNMAVTLWLICALCCGLFCFNLRRA